LELETKSLITIKKKETKISKVDILWIQE
jgi:hypothetical protein